MRSGRACSFSLVQDCKKGLCHDVVAFVGKMDPVHIQPSICGDASINDACHIDEPDAHRFGSSAETIGIDTMIVRVEYVTVDLGKPATTLQLGEQRLLFGGSSRSYPISQRLKHERKFGAMCRRQDTPNVQVSQS